MPLSKKSIVWNYFQKSSDNEKVTCTLCKKDLKYFKNTTNLHQHLIRIHPTLQTLQEERNTTSETQIASSSSSNQVPSIRESTSVHVSKKHKQLRLFATDNELSSSAKKDIDESLLKMIIKDFQPLSIVENEGFLEFIKKLQPLYSPPSRKQLTTVLLPNFYEKFYSSVINVIKSVENVAITTDIWTSDSNVAYITVTGHFIFNNKIETQVLETSEMVGSHTAENIANILQQIFEKWGISTKITTIVSDNGANIKCAINEYIKKHHHPCVAHTLNLSVNEAISKNLELTSIINKCRSLVGHFKHSVSSSDKLKKIQQQMNLPVLKLKQNVPTRWNSVLTMLERLLKVKDPLSVVINHISNCPGILDATEWNILEDCLQILKPIDTLTNILCGEKYITMSMIVPLIRGLQYNLKNLKTTTNVGVSLKQNLLDIVNRRLSPLESNKIVSKVTFLDPRFKKAAFGSEDNANKAYEIIKDELTTLLAKNHATHQVLDNETPATSSNCQNEDNLWAHFDSKLAQTKTNVTSSTSATLILRQYLEMPYLERHQDPLQFWQKYEATLPKLFQMACKYLCIPATSVPSERIFSKAGQLTNQRRNRLLPKNIIVIVPRTFDCKDVVGTFLR